MGKKRTAPYTPGEQAFFRFPIDIPQERLEQINRLVTTGKFDIYDILVKSLTQDEQGLVEKRANNATTESLIKLQDEHAAIKSENQKLRSDLDFSKKEAELFKGLWQEGKEYLRKSEGKIERIEERCERLEERCDRLVEKIGFSKNQKQEQTTTQIEQQPVQTTQKQSTPKTIQTKTQPIQLIPTQIQQLQTEPPELIQTQSQSISEPQSYPIKETPQVTSQSVQKTPTKIEVFKTEEISFDDGDYSFKYEEDQSILEEDIKEARENFLEVVDW